MFISIHNTAHSQKYSLVPSFESANDYVLFVFLFFSPRIYEKMRSFLQMYPISLAQKYISFKI